VPACKTSLDNQLRALNVPGLSAAIVKGGRLVCAAVAGKANVEQDRPVTVDTLFLIASVSKTVTATALMQLYEQKRLGLDDDVNSYLPFRISVPASPSVPITFRQLLTHTASIRDNKKYINCPDSCAYGSSPLPIVTRGADSQIALGDFVKGYFTPGGPYYDGDENFEDEKPGTTAKYSNMSMVLIGYLVEIISGTPFDRYCQNHIFRPLGMDKTSWRLANVDQSTVAIPYNKGWFAYTPYGHYGEPDYPDGMLRTSVTDLAQFLISFMEEGRYDKKQILNPMTVREMLKPQTDLDPSIGLGWFNQLIGKRMIWGHDGSDHGAGAKMWFDPTSREGVIILTNGIWLENNELLSILFREADQYD
jgi:CubicO group peptidase (beta-lactamase class C family)